MTIKIKDGDGMYDVYDDDSCEGRFFTRQGAVKFAKGLNNQPKRKHEWAVTKDSDDSAIPRSGPTWWMWVLIIVGTISLIALSY